MKTGIKAGVLFCGGCNPRFDRLQLYQRLCERFPEISFSVFNEDTGCDFILLINGCRSECLLTGTYPCPAALINTGDLNAACEIVDRCAQACG
ncbi:SelT/SelW/SelH family protein [Bacilliculturomica massiliensis]|uniref:hypothetical protein n=1 Tax=Bacilliculturomica massiliensis TaxID=1917867 RepID=UPI0010317CBD|nr:hypothetical protein [Bacilliculturomica massiliensis]